MAKTVYNELPVSPNGYPEKILKIQIDFIKEYPDPGFGTGKVGTAIAGSGKSAKHYKYTKSAREARNRAILALKKAQKEINDFAAKARLLIEG